MPEKFKSLAQNDQLFYGVLLVLVAICSFGLGRATIPTGSVPLEATVSFSGGGVNSPLSPPKATLEALPNQVSEASSSSLVAGAVIASKTGSKYHLPNCPGAKQIKSSNLISFNSVAEAVAAGYTPAANCPGLK
jgi:Metal binding domain of Ada